MIEQVLSIILALFFSAIVIYGLVSFLKIEVEKKN